MNAQMQAAWRKMVGIALLWVGLAAVVYVPASQGGPFDLIIAVVGFIAFASGLVLFTDGWKRDVVAQLLPREHGEHVT